MKKIWLSVFIVLLAVVCGALFRSYDLDGRIMHTDEAVHAAKFGELLEDNNYTYDKHEYHGPTLNYFSLIPAWIGDVENTSEVSDAMLRVVPVVFGVLLIALVLLAMDAIGYGGAVCAAILTAISGAMVYYSRYYIQEMLLVCFTFGVMVCGYRYTVGRKGIWAILSGVFVGLMFATKETCIISWVAMLIAMGGAAIMGCKEKEDDPPFEKTMCVWHILGAIVAAGVVAGLFFSSFFTNAAGVVDSILAYETYFDRAGGGTAHLHPMYYYLQILVYWNEGNTGLMFSEAFVVLLALVGFVSVFNNKFEEIAHKGFLRFIGFYTVMMLAVYSAMPYKTPWCLLGFWHGMILLAGVGASAIWRGCKGNEIKAFAGLLLVCGAGHLAWQSYTQSYLYAADPRNPYVYGHTETGFYEIIERIDDVAAAHPDGKQLYIEVVCAGDDYWPLPWYLREYSNVGWFNEVDMEKPAGTIIIVSATEEMQNDILHKLYEVPEPGKRDMYMPLFDEMVEELRPGVGLAGLVRKDAWDLYQVSEQEFTEKKMDEQPKVEYDKFSHVAMNTSFEIFIAGEEKEYAGQAARALFDELDRIEQRLSRYVENSDVSRVNSAKAGEAVVVSEDMLACLKGAKAAYEMTGGAFDVTVGALKDQDGGASRSKIGMDMVVLDEKNHTVMLKVDGVKIDLGGIGKGYAVERMATVLGEWEIERAMIHGGGSTAKALKGPVDGQGWNVSISDPDNASIILHELSLENVAISSSGLEHGSHIIDPKTGKPIKGRLDVRLLTDNAMMADALSTAMMLLSDEEVDEFIENNPEVRVIKE